MFQPNNRFVVNGNIGYRDDNFTKNKIIGDLDVEYMLTESGKYRLKAYNHTVDRYSLRAAPFIQGVGVVYKEEFNSWGELWRRYLNLFNSAQPKTDSIQSETNNIQADTTLIKWYEGEIEKNNLFLFCNFACGFQSAGTERNQIFYGYAGLFTSFDGEFP